MAAFPFRKLIIKLTFALQVEKSQARNSMYNLHGAKKVENSSAFSLNFLDGLLGHLGGGVAVVVAAAAFG